MAKKAGTGTAETAAVASASKPINSVEDALSRSGIEALAFLTGDEAAPKEDAAEAAEGSEANAEGGIDLSQSKQKQTDVPVESDTDAEEQEAIEGAEDGAPGGAPSQDEEEGEDGSPSQEEEGVEDDSPGGSPSQDDEVGSPEEALSHLTKESQHALDRRIAKEVGRRKQLEEEVAELRAQLASRGSASSSSTTDPLAGVASGVDLEVKRQEAEDAVDTFDDYIARTNDKPAAVEAALKRDGVQLVDPDTGEPDYSPERMREYLRGCRNRAKAVLRAVPRKQQELARTAQSAAAAMKLIPDLADKKGAHFKLFQEVLELAPELKANPEWPLVAAVHALGLERARELMKASGGRAQVKGGSSGAAPSREGVRKPVVIPKPKAVAQAAVPKAGSRGASAAKALSGDDPREGFTQYLAGELKGG